MQTKIFLFLFVAYSLIPSCVEAGCANPNCCSDSGVYSGCPAAWSFEVDQSKCQSGRLQQGNCGSCWAFASVGAAKDRRCQAGGGKKRLSEMGLLCSDKLSWISGDNDICNGGVAAIGMEMMASDGVVKYMNWPYAWGWGGKSGWNGDTRATKCEPKKTTTKNLERFVLEKGTSTTMTDYNYVSIGDISKLTYNKQYWSDILEKRIDAIKGSLYQYGPLPIAVNTMASFFHIGKGDTSRIYSHKEKNALNETIQCYKPVPGKDTSLCTRVKKFFKQEDCEAPSKR